jgi:protein TonB
MSKRPPLRGPGLAAPAAASLALHAAVLGAVAIVVGWFSGGGEGGSTLTIEAMRPQLPIVLAEAELDLPELPPLTAESPLPRAVAEEWALQLYERVPLSPPVTVWSEARAPREQAVVSAAATSSPAAVEAPAAEALTSTLIAPRLLAESCPAPPYPRLARRRSLEGTVWLILNVAADGLPASVQIERSSGHPILDDAALTAARAWRLAPATRNGAAEAGLLRVPITFRLEAQATGAAE